MTMLQRENTDEEPTAVHRIIRRASTFNTSRLDWIYSYPHSLKHNLHCIRTPVHMVPKVC